MVMVSKICQNNFMTYKLAERLANLLNYSLDLFTSKRGLKLKVNNMSEYGFNPKYILTSLMQIYESFVDFKDFLEFVVKDERSFKIENFEKVVTLRENGKIKIGFNEFENLKLLIKNLREISDIMKANQVSYEDAPDEYLDPITTDLMRDPVMLPSSKTIVDRTTIEQHLLSDPSDPFNRSHLTKEMLIDCVELKERINEYIQSKKIN